jgi:carboxylesterase type B
VLNATNCTDLKCLRSVPEEVIFTANNNLINFTKSDAGGGLFGMGVGFGPVPDGSDVPDMPLALYQQGKYHKEFGPMIVGTMAKEVGCSSNSCVFLGKAEDLQGEILSDDVDMPARFPTIVREVIPGASHETIAKIQGLYGNFSQPEELAWDWVTDMLFACNAYNLGQAYPKRASRYIMSLPPAVHGLDGECEITAP